MVKLTFVKCYWCGTTGAHKCKSCGQFTCWNCLVEVNDAGRCLHKKYEVAISDGWTDT